MLYQQPTINILGSGAIGLSFAKYLSLHNYPYQLITRATKQKNCMITQPPYVYNTTHIATLKTIDNYLLICTKNHQLDSALKQIKPIISKTCLIMLTQNGYINPIRFQSILPNNNFAYMPCLFGARIHNQELLITNPPETIVGPAEPTQLIAPILEVAKILNQNSIKTTYTQTINKELFKKLIINATLNGLGAINQCSHDTIFNTPRLYQQAKALCYESCNIINQHYFIDHPDNIWQAILTISKKIGTNHSSMNLDLQNNKTTEINYINGYIIDLAQKYGLHCPHNIEIYQKIEGYHAG